MNDGFTNHNSKGLFTFYKEQDQLERPISRLRLPITTERSKKGNHSSLSHYEYNKQRQRALIATKQPRIINLQSQRYTIIQEQSRIKTESNPNPIASLNFNLTASRKNEFYFQLLGSQNRKRQLQIDTCFKMNNPKLDYKKLINNLSVREIPAGQVKDLFKPRKDYVSNIHTIKKCPLKINSVIARCIEDDRHKGKPASLLTQNIEEDKMLHMPSVRQSQVQARTNRTAKTIFKDALELRRHLLQNSRFRQQLKEKKTVRQASAREANTRIEARTASIASGIDASNLQKG